MWTTKSEKSKCWNKRSKIKLHIDLLDHNAFKWLFTCKPKTKEEKKIENPWNLILQRSQLPSAIGTIHALLIFFFSKIFNIAALVQQKLKGTSGGGNSRWFSQLKIIHATNFILVLYWSLFWLRNFFCLFFIFSFRWLFRQNQITLHLVWISNFNCCK